MKHHTISQASPERFLTSVIISTDKYTGDILRLVKKEYFQDEKLATMFEFCRNMYLKDNSVVDMKAFQDIKEFERDFHVVSSDYISGANYQYYCKRIKEEYEQRVIEQTKKALLETSSLKEQQAIIEQTQKSLKNDDLSVKKVDSSDISMLMDEYVDGFDAVKSGYGQLDSITNGFFPGEIIILAGASGMGKTATALNIALNMAKQKKKVMFVSLEMKRQALINRLICAEGGILASKYRSCGMDASEIDKYENVFNEKIKPLDLYITDNFKLTVKDITLIAKDLKQRNGLDVLFVDYLGLVTPDRPHRSKYEEVSEVSRQLKVMAGELNIPVFVLCQISRDVKSRNDKRPLMSDLKDSGSIENDADIVMLCYRDEYYNAQTTQKPGIIEILVPKHRSGSGGVAELRFEKEYQLLRNRGIY